jgi:hypothetical protein
MTVLICAICGCDKFFLSCNGDGCILSCSGCGVQTGARISEDDRGNLVEAPK